MKTPLLLFLLSLFLFSTSFAQVDELRNEILNYEDPKTEIIGKGRKLLLDKFLAGDKQKVDEVLHYLLSSVEDKDYLALYPAERVLLYYWTDNYARVLTDITQFDSVYFARMYRQIRPPHDRLQLVVQERMQKERHTIKRQIDATQLSAADKDFLKLNLDFLLRNRESPDISQDSLNYHANRFLDAHPSSMYQGFVRQNIRYQYQPSKWGFGYEFFIGYGNFSGELGDRLRNSVPWGFGFETHYQRAALFLRLGFADSRTRDSVSVQNITWRRNTRLRGIQMEAAAGLVVLDAKILRLIPFASIATFELSPLLDEEQKYPEYKDTALGYAATYIAGLQADLKFKHSGPTSMHPGQGQSFWMVRLRYSYQQPQFSRRHQGFAGNFHTITAGFGIFGRTMHRVL